MKHVKLDRIDLKILRELQQDGRITNVDLAKLVGISAPPCLRRVRALEESGYIRGYHGDIAADKMGYGITVFTQVSLINHSESDLNNFARQVEAWPQVRECYMMTGENDFLLKIVAEDWDAFQKFLTNLLGNTSNIQHAKSAPVMKRIKYAYGVPLDSKSEPQESKE
ncbi:MAG: Lrp/AsnC family transcriptional regulator [Alphaproteobacteria bacterium]|nr:Lrp/AsnC family transcriptional regulator [Alphaproteobacteria bacterium]